MAIGKLSLRQKMINMMYLVLLAILALNVSAEVLKAFYMMEVSMRRTGENIDAKNNLVLKSFDALMVTQKERTKEWNAKAREGEKITADFVQYVEGLKKEVEGLTGGRVVNDNGQATELKNSDNTEKHANYFLNKGKGQELRAKINEVRDKLLALVPEVDRRNIKTDLFTLDEGTVKWESSVFEGVPAAAVMATLTKLQNDCKNTYGDVLNVLLSKTSGTVVNIDRLEAQIIPKSNYVMAGEKFEANIFLAASDSKQPAEIVLDGQSFTSDSGSFNYTKLATSHGEHQVKGVIRVHERDGIKEYPFNTKYNVFGGFAAVSADAMNIMYIGVDNPVSVSVPGVPPDRVIATINNGTLTKAVNNKYVAKVSSAGTASITVSVRDDEGKVKAYGSYPFTVRRLPPPIVRLGNLKPGPVSKGELGVMSSINAFLGPDFYFQGVNYKVVSYSCGMVINKNYVELGTFNGGIVPETIKDKYKNLKKGDIVIFHTIKTSGPPSAPQPEQDNFTFTIK
ncbi:MAG TPA: gliding motility protein GldM [Bacteroidia bacterium]|nr:gliding motility protein GldM [Bacteroidia bacterium]